MSTQDETSIVPYVQPVPVLSRNILESLAKLGVGDDKISEKMKDLLDAKTLNAKGMEMNDNKVVLDTIKLILNLNGMKTGGLQINLFNISKPGKDDKLEY